MADTFKFDLVSPERLLMSEEVIEVVVPGSDGQFGVLRGHAPFMSTIQPGFIVVKRTDGEESRIFIRGGFADTGPGGLTILAEQAMPAEDLDSAHLAQEIDNAREDLQDAKSDTSRHGAETRLGQLQEMQDALSKL